MPIYEYCCEEDGEVIELLRPMCDADAPVDDPAGKGRTFRRVQSTFQVGEKPSAPSMRPPTPGCGCGNPHGPCGL